MSLFKKLSLSIFVIFLVLITGLLWIFDSIESNSRAQAEQELHKQLAAHLVHDNPLLSYDNITSDNLNYDTIGNLFRSMMILGANFEFYILNVDGVIVNYSAKPGEVIKTKVGLGPIDHFLNNTQQFPIYGEDPRSSGHKIFSAAEIKDKDITVGYLYVIVRSQIYDGIVSRVENNRHLQTTIAVTILGIIFLFSVIFLSLRYFVSPLKKVIKTIESIKQSGFEDKLTEIESSNSGVEIELLVTTFNKMINQINDQFEQLKRVDGERRELLTHLSHDLRTPLASLQGFLETIAIQKSTISHEKQFQYIQRSLVNAERLRHFVDQIFELAHLESGHVSATLESIPIAELLYDLKDKFEIQATENALQLNVELDNEAIRINTDIAKLERVLTNLIENAIRHTPSGGSITLKLASIEQAKQVRVIVQDSGIGIPEEELPYLFDARYRGSKTAEDGQRHIGLGLTISKKLLRVLGSEIKVRNNPDKGANFSFCLPVV